MKNHHHMTRWLLIGAAFVVVSLFAYGSWRYRELQENNNRLTRTVTELRQTIEELESNLSLTEYEREKLGYVLEQTALRAGELEAQTQELGEKVGEFEKLSLLDPELLKKYSKVYFLNEHYEPSGIVAIDPLYVNGAGREMQIHESVWPFLENLLEDSTEEKLGLLVTSAYRSFGTQAALKTGYKVTYGAGTANQFSADQGYSEHQLGTTVDFTTTKTRNLSSAFEATPEFKWLTEHAHEYGFVLSYPKGNKYYIYEPWHWRFVGVALATVLHDEQKTLYGMDQREIDQYLLGLFD